MIELLAAIQSVDPMSAMLWAFLVFAAGMYPVGIMLGSSCSPCCDQGPCPCPTGTLPDTLTVTFSGLQDQARGSDLLGLSFSSCFGSGAAGRILEPGGVAGVDDGPIESISLTKSGGGYAKYGRVEPTLTATGSGTGAAFAITLAKSQDACSVDYWRVSSIAVTKGGTNYDDGEVLTITVAEGDTEEVAASATASTTRSAPNLSVTATPGSGGVFAVTTDESGSSWTISSVSVTSGGSGYVDYTQMTVGLGTNDVEEFPAYLYVRTGRTEPAVSLSISSENGTGAVLTPTLTKTTGYDGRDVWNISAITITQAGGGYEVNDFISATVQDGQESYYGSFYAYVSEVGQSGEITATDIQYQGEYFKDNGIAESVEISGGGSYYNDDGVITKVTLGGGGVYYREDKNATPYVAPVTVTIDQKYPSSGTGGEIVATVDSDTSKATFGQIANLTIAKAGDDYLAWEWKNTKCCGWYWNDKPVVLRREFESKIDTCALTFDSCFGSGAAAYVSDPGLTYEDPPGPIEKIALTSGGSGYAKYGRVQPTVTASAPSGSGGSLSVSLSDGKDSCGLDYWTVSGVTVTKAGTGYTNGAKVSFSAGAGITEAGALATIVVGRSAPTLTATPTGSGSGAALSINTTPRGTTPETWKIDSIAVTNGGTGYVDNKSVTITPTGTSTTVTSASAAIRTTRLEPTLEAKVYSDTGSGAELVPVLSSFANTDGRTVWGVSSFTTTKAGEGYKANNDDYILVTVSDGQQVSQSYGFVTGVDSEGAITATKATVAGKFFKDGGVIDIVTLSNSGAYYQDDGIQSVTLTSGGIYYGQDASLSPYVADVEVGFAASCPGSGASVSAVIDTSTKSLTFGQITGITIESPGNGYVGTIATPGGYWTQRPCTYSHYMCGGWNNLGAKGHVYLQYRGQSLPPYIVIYTEYLRDSINTSFVCNNVFVADGTLADCGQWDGITFNQTNPAQIGFDSIAWQNAGAGPGTATVTPTGTYDKNYKAGNCHQCCQGEDEIPQEIEVEIEQNAYESYDLAGTYVLGRSYSPGNLYAWGFSNSLNELNTVRFNVSLGISTGMCVEGASSDCDGCIKKCQLDANVSLSYHPAVWFSPSDADMRYCPYYSAGNYDGTTPQEEIARQICAAVCYDTPLCRPPSGETFYMFQPSGSENWSQVGCPDCCDPNDDPTWQAGDPFEGPFTGPPRPNHLNTFVMTVL